jgi:purine-binding chemotaxis protein CheW
MKSGSEASNGTTPAGPSSRQVLTFALGDEVFGTDISSVREIIQHGPMTIVPLMPKFVRGVINLRGAVVPVIDLQVRFGRPPAKVGKKSCVVIYDAMRAGERVELGLLVDSVSAVIEIAATAIEPAPSFGAAVRREFISGMVRVGARFIILLEPDKAFDVEEMAQLCDRTQQAAAEA